MWKARELGIDVLDQLFKLSESKDLLHSSIDRADELRQRADDDGRPRYGSVLI